MLPLRFATQLQMFRQAPFPLSVIAKGLMAKLHEAKASMEIDRCRILNHIAGRLDLAAATTSPAAACIL